MSQRVPVNPWAHLHLNVLMPSSQIPSFIHSFGTQSSTSVISIIYLSWYDWITIILVYKHTLFTVRSSESKRTNTCIWGNSVLTCSAIVARGFFAIINIYKTSNHETLDLACEFGCDVSIMLWNDETYLYYMYSLWIREHNHT